MSLVPLLTCNSAEEASALRALLEAHGIPCVVQGEHHRARRAPLVHQPQDRLGDEELGIGRRKGAAGRPVRAAQQRGDLRGTLVGGVGGKPEAVGNRREGHPLLKFLGHANGDPGPVGRRPLGQRREQRRLAYARFSRDKHDRAVALPGGPRRRDQPPQLSVAAYQRNRPGLARTALPHTFSVCGLDPLRNTPAGRQDGPLAPGAGRPAAPWAYCPKNPGYWRVFGRGASTGRRMVTVRSSQE